MDADYTADLGRSMNSRPESYRLTNPDNHDSGSTSNPALTGFDSGAHATLSRSPASQQEVQERWSSSGSHRTVTEAEPAQQNSRTEYRGSDFGSGEYGSNPSTSPFGATPAAPNTGYGSADTGSAPFGTAATNGSAASFAAPSGTAGSSFGNPSTTADSSFGSPSTSTASSFGAPPASFSAPPAPSEPSSPSHAAGSVGAHASPAAPSAPAQPAVRPAASSATVEPQHVMRLLLASHELDTAATRAEAGEGSVAELARAAHSTRSAAVDLIAAWYGGADHMRNFAEALLQAAAESA
ncbi:hypothetical protein [Nocardia sp. NPDC050406]|uniref:hypothetical protein n=1 Tax=Nocardia sp. NPDC050406 TaxID=3364318 RepID=UPI0037999F2F